MSGVLLRLILNAAPPVGEAGASPAVRIARATCSSTDKRCPVDSSVALVTAAAVGADAASSVMVGCAPREDSVDTGAVAAVGLPSADAGAPEACVPVDDVGAAAAVVPTAGCGVPATTTGAAATAGPESVAG